MPLMNNGAIIILLSQSTIKKFFAKKKSPRVRRQHFLLCSSLFITTKNVKIFNIQRLFGSLFFLRVVFRHMWDTINNLSLDRFAQL